MASQPIHRWHTVYLPNLADYDDAVSALGAICGLLRGTRGKLRDGDPKAQSKRWKTLRCFAYVACYDLSGCQPDLHHINPASFNHGHPIYPGKSDAHIWWKCEGKPKNLNQAFWWIRDWQAFSEILEAQLTDQKDRLAGMPRCRGGRILDRRLPTCSINLDLLDPLPDYDWSNCRPPDHEPTKSMSSG